ncbi:oligosaccharide flippase family protein [Catenovulum maritimum]|uniref:Uncharacterized protein n=1 Tax=Catenovulum maritimum TaxID=1513271 RepID=A0A0J8JJ36_9ALTE|nr:oligosaccharide flippase family protein [Catenovulum maritimum]KMT64456.1 hypothetical protein XM47_14280 [Catenovulum maritimum]
MTKKPLYDIAKVIFVRFSSFLFIYPLAILLSRQLGAEGYGLYGTLMAYIPIIATICICGVDQFLVKQLAESNPATGFTSNLTRYFKLVSGLCFGALLCLAWINLEFNLFPIAEFITACLILIFLVIRRVQTALLRGIKLPVPTQVAENIVQPIATLFLVLIGILWFDFTVLSALILYLVGLCLSVLFLSFSVKKRFRLKPADNASASLGLKDVALTLPFLGLALTNDIATYIDRIMLASMQGYSQAGVYLVVARNASLILVAVTSIQLVINPYIAEFKANHSKQSLAKLASYQVVGQTLLSITALLPIALISLYVGDIFGSEFSSAAGPLMILATGYVVTMVLGSGVQYLFMSGYSLLAFQIVFFATLLNVILNFLLIPEFGIYGAVYATIASEACKKLLAAFVVTQKLQLRIDLYPAIFYLAGKRAQYG